MRIWKIYKKITQLPLLVPYLTKLFIILVLTSSLNLIRGKKEKISDNISSFVKSCKDKINVSLDFK